LNETAQIFDKCLNNSNDLEEAEEGLLGGDGALACSLSVATAVRLNVPAGMLLHARRHRQEVTADGE